MSSEQALVEYIEANAALADYMTWLGLTAAADFQMRLMAMQIHHRLCGCNS